MLRLRLRWSPSICSKGRIAAYTVSISIVAPAMNCTSTQTHAHKPCQCTTVYNTHRATPSTHLQHTQSHTQHTSTTQTEPHPAHIYNTHRATPSTYHTFTQPKADQSSAHQGSINYAHTYIKTKVVSASSFKYLYITFPNQEPSTPHETGFNFSPKLLFFFLKSSLSSLLNRCILAFFK